MIEWFGGNEHALSMYENIKVLSHIWDDIVDKDRDLPDEDINKAFSIALLNLPANPFYYEILPHILPFWEMVISSYETANHFEATKDAHGIEIAHSLRYAAGHIVAFAIIRCVGWEKSKEYLPLMWKDVFFERFDEYREEHLG